MALVPLADLGRYDALYVSPHADDAALSCAGRLLGERARGQRVLVLLLFESEAGPAVTELLARGTDVALAGLARYLLRVNAAPSGRGDLRGWADRFGSFGAAAGEWRSARAWNPQKAFGPRLQPMVHPADAGVASQAEELWASIVPTRGSRSRAADRFRTAALAYARKVVGGASHDHAERYWLVLPSLPGATQPTRPEELESVLAR